MLIEDLLEGEKIMKKVRQAESLLDTLERAKMSMGTYTWHGEELTEELKQAMIGTIKDQIEKLKSQIELI